MEYRKQIYDNPMKVCIKCKRKFNLEFFYEDSSNKRDGHRGKCKFCCAEADKYNKEINKEKIAKIKKDYYEKNKKEISAYKKKWYRQRKKEQNYAI